MIYYNNPEYAKERQNVVPLDNKEINIVIEGLSAIKSISSGRHIPFWNAIQRLIWHYENLVHNNEVNVPELKRLLSEKKIIQAEMDKIVQCEWFETGKENDNEFYKLVTRKNEITEQIEKLIEQL